jgi:hypothetical protein
VLTQARLKEVLKYNRKTGVFTWRTSGKGRRARNNLVAGCSSDSGGGKVYQRIRVDGTLYHAHRLAWFYVHGEWPPTHTDHRRGPGNQVSNLRACTVSQNLANSKLRSDNTSGYKGVSKLPSSSKWKAQIRSKHLGCFVDARDAAIAYDKAAVLAFGSFALTNRKLGLL